MNTLAGCGFAKKKIFLHAFFGGNPQSDRNAPPYCRSDAATAVASTDSATPNCN
jgi:hypothetical protein